MFWFFLSAFAEDLPRYDIAQITEGTCTPVKVTSQKEMAYISIGTVYVPKIPEVPHIASVTVSDTRVLETCWPDKIGKQGLGPVIITMVHGVTNMSADFFHALVKWNTGRAETLSTNFGFGTVEITLGESRTIQPQ